MSKLASQIVDIVVETGIATRCIMDTRLSHLYYADKLSMPLEPAWLYLPRVTISGEIREFRDKWVNGHYTGEELEDVENFGVLDWYVAARKRMRKLAYKEI